ncbi:hypothetical protein Q0M94_19550 (plasmid) [Deinococcus radiomollis]|uniref:antitoxin VbhA family protein n=1 Tax=Deinococcus radiomollis TaxID=468916 RepID=UPI0038921BF4
MDTDREQQVDSARHSQQLSGGDISDSAQQLNEEYIAGAMTSGEMRRRILAEYGQPEEQAPQTRES